MDLAVGLLGAIIGAAAVVTAQFLSSRSSVRLENEKQLRTDVGQTTRSLLEALQASQWLVWKARYDSEGLEQADFDAYNEDANAGLAAITGHLGVLASTWPKEYTRYEPLAAKVFEFDQRVGEAIVAFRSDPTAGIAQLQSMSMEILSYHWYAYRQVSRVIEGMPVEEYVPSAWER